MFNRGGIHRVRHFPCKFPHKMALVKCPYAFRLCGLAQNGCRGISVRQFSCTFLRKIHCSCEMSMCMSTAQARAKRDISHRNLAKRPLIGSLFRDLAKRPLTEILPTERFIELLYKDLARRPLINLIELLYRDQVKRAAIFLRDLLYELEQRSYFEVPHRDLL